MTQDWSHIGCVLSIGCYGKMAGSGFWLFLTQISCIENAAPKTCDSLVVSRLPCNFSGCKYLLSTSRAIVFSWRYFCIHNFFFHLIFNLFLNLCSAKHFFFAVHYCNCLSVCVCVGHPGGRKVEVQFVDLGNRKILSVSDLRKIKDEFFALPARVRPQNFMYFLFFNYYSLSEFIACKQNLQYL